MAIQVRRGTAADWTSANPTLAAGEVGYETDTERWKIGNGTQSWTALTYRYGNELGTIAYAENRSGTTTTFGTAATVIPGLTVVVPPIERDVWIEWNILIGFSVLGQGAVLTILYDVTDGVAALIDQYHTHHGPNTPVTINGPTHRASARVGPSSVERVFGIYGMVVREASTSLTPYARNLTNSGKSWMTAVAR